MINDLLFSCFRLLDEIDPDIQLKVIDCLLNWKDDYLIPYDQHLRNLIISRNIREELTTWTVSKESEYIQKEHRAQIIPVIIRLLAPKVRKMKKLALQKVLISLSCSSEMLLSVALLFLLCLFLFIRFLDKVLLFLFVFFSMQV